MSFDVVDRWNRVENREAVHHSRGSAQGGMAKNEISFAVIEILRRSRMLYTGVA